jgi:hypothetical protein
LRVTEPASAAPAERAGGLSYKGVYVALFGLLLAAGVVAGLMYFKLLHYRRVAALHLPPDTTVAARIDLEDVVLFEPVRKHLLTLANTLRARDPRLKPRLKRLEQHTRIEFTVDLREIAVARGATPGDWVVIFGGLFPKEKVVSGLRQVFVEEGIDAQLSPSGESLTLPGGLAVGQSQDGCILIAASAPRLESALPQQDTFQRLRLAPDGAGGFAVSGNFLPALADAPVVASVAELNEIERARGQLRLGNPGEISSQVELRTKGDPAETERRIGAVVDALRAFAAPPPAADHGGERRILENARSTATGPGLAKIVAPWERADVDRAAESLARALRAWVEGPQAPRQEPRPSPRAD